MHSADPFTHLELRCKEIIARYLDPIIGAENAALAAGSPLPAPDFESLAVFRLLAHAELEEYFESKASTALAILDSQFKANSAVTHRFAALIFFQLWQQRREPQWASIASANSGSLDEAEFKRLAQEALGFGRQFIAGNNGIKEASIHALSAFIGHYPSELDGVLVEELNQFGRRRGDVAHFSWMRDTRTFDSADIEKNRLTNMIASIKAFYESGVKPVAQSAPRRSLFSIAREAVMRLAAR
jgi:hypothetical protein